MMYVDTVYCHCTPTPSATVKPERAVQQRADAMTHRAGAAAACAAVPVPPSLPPTDLTCFGCDAAARCGAPPIVKSCYPR